MLSELNKYNEIILYGTGVTARIIIDFLRREGLYYKIKCVADRNVGVDNIDFEGFNVIPRENITQYVDKDTAIIIASQSFISIISYLIGINATLDLDNIYIANNYIYPPPYSQNDEIIPVTDSKYQKLASLLSDDVSKTILNNIINVRCNNYRIIFPYNWIHNNNLDDIYGSEHLYWELVKPPKSCNNAVVIDCGAYTGDSISPISNSIKQHISEYYAFEPSSKSYDLLNMLPKSDLLYDKLIPINKGVSDSDNFEKFAIGNVKDRDNQIHLICGDDDIISSPIEVIYTTKIDNFSLDKSCDIFIKMDIEGSEMNALIGAEKLIKERKPNLAICVYHKPNDIVDIPLYLKSLVPEYNIYLTGGPHTICQAQVDEQFKSDGAI